MSDIGPRTFSPTPRHDCKGGGKRVWVSKSGWGWSTDVTPRQRDVYLFIRYFWRQYGYGPSYKEVASGLNLKSRQNIIRIVRILKAKRLIETDGSKRGMKPYGVSIERLVIDRMERIKDKWWKNGRPT